jgi:CRP/FNR family cyclic AMP-dependent transcriptional regulator
MFMQIETKELRKRFPSLTKHTSLDEVGAFTKQLVMRYVEPGEVVIEDGKPSESLFLVWDGELSCYIEDNGEKVEIGHIMPGQYIGEVSIIDPGNATASVETITNGTLLELTRSNFVKLEKEHPLIASKLIRAIDANLITRLRASDEFLLNVFNHKYGELSASPQLAAQQQEWFTHIYQRLIGVKEVEEI